MHSPAPVQTVDACTPTTAHAQKLSRLDPSAHGWLTAAEVAEALGLTVRAVQKAAQQGRIVARKPGWSRGWLIPAAELARLVEAEGVRHGH